MSRKYFEIYQVVEAANELLLKHGINEQLICVDEDLRYFTLTAINNSTQAEEKLFTELTRNQAFNWLEGFMTAMINKRFND